MVNPPAKFPLTGMKERASYNWKLGIEETETVFRKLKEDHWQYKTENEGARKRSAKEERT